MANCKFIAEKHPKYERADVLAPIGVYYGNNVVEYWRRGKNLGTFVVSNKSYKKYKSGKPICLSKSGYHLRDLNK